MEQNIEELLAQAEQLPNGSDKIALLEEAIRIADMQQDREQSYQIRIKLLDTAYYSGRPDKSIASFAWCLAQYDQNPEMYDEHQLMWKYKFIVGEIDSFPQIQKSQITEMLEDLHRRYTSLGYSSRVYYQLMQGIAARSGDFTLEAEAFKKWQEQPRDSMCSCPTCELSRQVNYWLLEGEFSQAYPLAQPILNRELSCGRTLESTYASFLIPLLEEKRYQEAEEFYQRGYPPIKDKPGFLFEKDDYLRYLMVVDQKEAVRCMERHLPVAIRLKVPFKKYLFYMTYHILLEMLPDPDSVRFPEGFTRQHLERELYEIARQFDLRNQNNYYTKWMADERERMQKLCQEWKQEQEK